MSITEFDEGWILGFIEGEGSFTRQLCGGRIPQGTGKPKYLPSFCLNQVYREPVDYIKNFFGGGRVYVRDYTGKKYWSSKKSIRYDYCIRDRATLEKIRDFCDGRLKHPGKIADLEKWKDLFNNYVGIESQKQLAREEMNRRWATPAYREKMAEARRKRWTPEARKRQSERLKKRWELKKLGKNSQV